MWHRRRRLLMKDMYFICKSNSLGKKNPMGFVPGISLSSCRCHTVQSGYVSQHSAGAICLQAQLSTQNHFPVSDISSKMCDYRGPSPEGRKVLPLQSPPPLPAEAAAAAGTRRHQGRSRAGEAACEPGVPGLSHLLRNLATQENPALALERQKETHPFH